MRKNTSDPRALITQLSQLNSSAMQSFNTTRLQSPPPAGAPGAGIDANYILQTQLGQQQAFFQYQQQVQTLINEATLQMDLQQRDNEQLNNQVDSLTATVEKLQKDLEGLTKSLTDQKTASDTALADAAKAHGTEKTDLEKKLSDLEKNFATLQGDLQVAEADLKAAKEKIATLESEKQTLTEEKEAAEKNAKSLGAAKLGLVKSVTEGTTTEQGKPTATTKKMTAAELAAAGKEPAQISAIPSEAQHLQDLAVVYSDMLKLQSQKHTAHGMRAYMAFRNEPVPGCEGCKADPQHHSKLIVEAVKNRDKIVAYAASVA